MLTMTTQARNATRLDLPRRPRRLRRSAAMRAMVREARLSPGMFVYPLFVRSGEGQKREIGSMPGVYQMSVDEIVQEAAAAKPTAFRPCCSSGYRTRRT